MEGKPWKMKPVDIGKMTGPWALLRLTMEWRKVQSSTSSPR